MDELIHKLVINGMTCDCCTDRVLRVLRSNPNVLDAELSFKNDSGVIKTTNKLSVDNVIEIIREAGFIASV